ncbi:MAG: M48 family metallopeptidase [Phycisphaerales bacterium]|nr:M48 family metallopeptidase [Phycisphaerales bacterium]
MHSIVVGTETIEYLVTRSDRSTTRLIVNPDGAVEVRTSLDRPDKSIASFVQCKARWILRQQVYFESFRPRVPERRFVSGETVRYLGRQYRLRIECMDREDVKLLGGHLRVFAPRDAGQDLPRRLVEGWYKNRAKDIISKRLAICLAKASPHGVTEPPLLIHWMTRRWGSCTPAGRVLINPLLMIAPLDCVDYVVMHEMCHLKHPSHSHAFYRLLDTTMPDWPQRRIRLASLGQHLTM